MKLHRILFISFCIFFFSVNQGIIAQDRGDYALLWKISHKESNKESYLFGTFHSRDNKVFQFSDSVIPAIKTTEAFALEVHPDSISSGFFDNLFEDREENIYRKVLSEEEYQRLNDRYEELNGEPLDSVSYMNPLYIETALTKDDPKEDDKSTFLDAYLYGVASHFKRDIYGLEKLEDQMQTFEEYSQEEIRNNVLEILNTDEERSKEYLEYLKDLYYDGNIDALFNEITDNRSWDADLSRRNHIMANKMEKIMQNQSLFAAVGAAHLPGEEGIISLMRKKGFRVTKVTPTFNDDLENLQFLPNLDNWFLDQRPNMGFDVKVPSEPQTYEIREDVFSMISMDLISGRYYAYVVADFRGKKIKDGYNFTDNILQGHTQGDSTKIVSKKQYEKYGYMVDEVIVKNEDGLLKTVVIPTEKMIYAFMEQSALGDGFDSPYSQAYYNSIKIFPPIDPPVVWDTFYNEAAAMSLEAPAEITDISREVANPLGEDQSPYQLNMYLAKDNPKEMIYIIRYNDQPNGHYIKDISDYNEELTANFANKGSIISGPTDFKVNNAEGIEYEVLLGDSYHAIARFMLRGNRTYVLLAQKTTKEKKVDKNDPFFTSFKYLTHKPAVFDTVINMENRYELKLPNKVEYEVTDVYEYGSKMDSIVSYFSTDKSTGGVYGMERAYLKPYAEYESYKTAYKDYTEYILEEEDSILSKKDITISGIPAREILLQNELTNIKQRIQMLLHDDSMFLLLTYLGDEELEAPSTQLFFDSFEIKKFNKTFDPFASKKKTLLKDLKSKDSTTFYKAKNALDYYSFTEKDISKLISLLKSSLLDDKKSYNARSSIIELMANIDSPKVLDQIKKYYLDKSTSDSDKSIILVTLPLYNNQNALSTYFDFLENHKLIRKKADYFYPFYPFQDSLELATKHEAHLSKLLKVDDYRDQIVELYNLHIDNDSISNIRLTGIKENIFNHLVIDSQDYIDTIQRQNKPHIDYQLINNYISIIRKLKIQSEDVSKSLKLLYTHVEELNWLRTRALLTAIWLGYEVDDELLQQRMANYYSRYEIMEGLVDVGKSELIPEKYWHPDEFTTLSMYNMAGYDDDYPDLTKPIGKVSYNEMEYLVYTLQYTAEGKEYLGMAEYKEGDPKNLQLNEGYTDWDEIDKENWKEQALQLIKDRYEE